MTEFQVHKNDIKQTRLVNRPSDKDLLDGQIKVKVEAFSFTANNISYWATGDKLNYWQFFPAADNDDHHYGIIPVWGFAQVTASKVEGVPVGERLFGYFPMAETWVMQPTNISNSTWFDGCEHRQSLAAGYNIYRRVAVEPGYDRSHDEMRMLLFPLHITSFCLHDMLSSQNWLGAEQIVIVSASSKTSLGLAFALSEDTNAPQVVGMTSARNVDFVDQTGYYQLTFKYDELQQIDANKKTVIVDMSGNGELLSQLHGHLQDNMVFSSHVGLTHWEDTDRGSDFIAARSKMFFAPYHIQQRYQDWGADKFERLANAFMQRAAVDCSRWLELINFTGLAGLNDQFAAISQGKLPAHQGLVVKL